MISYIRAFAYYILVLIYGFIYNFIIECLSWFGINLGYDYYYYYFSHAFLLILKVIGIRIHLIGKPIINFRAIWISNHRSHFDGFFTTMMLVLHRNHVISIGRYVPLVGSLFNLSNFVFIKRNKQSAQNSLVNAAHRSITNDMSILIFPEGTAMTPANKQKSDEYATSHNQPIFKNILLPRTTGYDSLVKNGIFRMVGNMTIIYPELPGHAKHHFADLFKMCPKDIYIHTSYDKASTDLITLFNEKDNLISNIDLENEEEYPLNYSEVALVINCLLLVGFGFACYYIPYFALTTIIVNSVFFIKSALRWRR